MRLLRYRLACFLELLPVRCLFESVFFFEAEDGIRDSSVTGVQTCALPISDIANFLACQHIATLNREEAEGKITKKLFADPGAELLRRLGLEHEQNYLRQLTETQGLKVVEIQTDVPWSEAAAATIEAMVQGVGAIYQATFLNGTLDVPFAPDAARGGRAARGPSEEFE